MIKDSGGKLKKFKEWNSLAPGIQGPSLFIWPVGMHGVLYPPHSLSEEALDEEIFMRLSPYSDETWAKAMSLLKKIECKKVSPFCPNYFHIRGVRGQSLNKINSTGTKDKQIQAVFEYFNLYTVIGNSINHS
ncbi:MAG: hypothetical protein OS130_11660 [Thermodesulfobacteriota bacterium]|jgi:hypothetical protein|nr:MAG: hypothetical protein OS130_11660 [Thermodesulfobacteriota bacterium]